MENKEIETSQRLDEYWWGITEINDHATEKRKYKNLADTVFVIMSLSVSNAEAERGFSTNKRILDSREGMPEQTLVNYRLVKCFIILHKNDCLKINITNEMLIFANRSHKQY